MQFTTIIAALFTAAVAVAVPAPPQLEQTIDDRSIFGDIENATIGSCEIVQCATALGPAIVGCAAAAAQAFVDPISDAACLAAAVNDGVNLPSECDGCDPLDL